LLKNSFNETLKILQLHCVLFEKNPHFGKFKIQRVPSV